MRLRRLHRSLTFRLALLSLLLFSLAVALLLGAVWAASIVAPLRSLERLLDAEASEVRTAYQQGGIDAAVQTLEARPDLPSQPYYALVDEAGRWIAGSQFDDRKPYGEAWMRLEFFERDGRGDDDAIARGVPLGPGVIALVARDIESITDREQVVLRAIGWSAVIAPSLGLVVGLLMSIAVARRIDAVTGTARRVMAGDLSERVALQGTGDDFDQLAATLNTMLSRIDGLVQSVSTVSDQVAHELRTPLTRLRAELESLSAAASDPALADRADRALAEANRLQSIFDALLRIARIESGRHALAARPVDLGRLIDDAAALYGPEGDARRVTVVAKTSGSLIVKGDPDLLFQAICNLVDNAVKFAPACGAVWLDGAREAGSVTLTIRDNGRGIPNEDHARVFARFYRAPCDEDRPGLGLGLPLVAAVARAHGGAVSLKNCSPGLEVTLQLPVT